MAQAQTSPWAGVPYNPDVTVADTSPWAKQPLPTDEGAPSTALLPSEPMQTLEPPKLDLHANLPTVFAPAPKLNPQDEITGHLQGKLEKDYEKDANPWGSPTNHPGFFGKLAHGLSVATGGDTRRGWEEQGLAKELNDVVGQKSANDYRGAEQAKTEEDTAEAPQKASDLHIQSGATTANLNSEVTEHNAQAAALLHPQAKTDFEAWQVQNPGKPIEQWLKAQQASKTPPRPDTPEQQYLDEYAKKNPGSSVADAERHYTLDTQRPPQVTPIMVMVPNANGGQTATVIRPGSEVAPGAQTMAGVNAANTPTTQMRNTAQRAELVHSMVPEVISDIDKNADQLGPMMGRWNDFMQGKVGSDNPSFAQLRADLLLMSSSVALAHAQGRLPENLRAEFDHIINSPKQTPENLKATLTEIDKWMSNSQNVMQHGNTSQNAPKPVSSGATEGSTKTNSSGDTIVFKDGKWQTK